MTTLTTPTASPAYRIGWWTHQWWPSRVILRCLLTGKQPSPRADNGTRKASRAYYVRLITSQMRRLKAPHRPWQSEAEGPATQFARRSFTAAGAQQAMQRDVDHWLRTGEASTWQRWRCWRKVTRCRVGWHRMYDLRAGRACLSCGTPAGARRG